VQLTYINDLHFLISSIRCSWNPFLDRIQ
jgi:hypothetical protein